MLYIQALENVVIRLHERKSFGAKVLVAEVVSLMIDVFNLRGAGLWLQKITFP